MAWAGVGRNIMTRVLLTHTPGAFARYYGDSVLQHLQALAHVERHMGARPLDDEALIERARGCDIIVSDRATPGEAGLFSQASELVAFVRCAVDIRTVDVDAASANGVLVTHASPGFVDSVSELVLGMMVDLARGISAASAAYHRGALPDISMGTQLRGATLGVVGYGAIGSRLAVIGAHLGMNVMVHDPRVDSVQAPAQRVELPSLLKASDFVICLAIATDSTENLFDANAFSLMKSSAFFINASRGNLVDEQALHAVLDEKRIAGAAMDVGRAADQMPSMALASLPNVIATPHIGGLTRQAVEHQAMETVAQVTCLLQGEIPAGAVNAEHASRLEAFFRRYRS